MENRVINASAWVQISEPLGEGVDIGAALDAIKERLQDAPVGLALVSGVEARRARERR